MVVTQRVGSGVEPAVAGDSAPEAFVRVFAPVNDVLVLPVVVGYRKSVLALLCVVPLGLAWVE